MKKITLTAKENSYLEQRHKNGKQRTECDRIKAVLLCSEGWSAPMISQALRLLKTTIYRHLSDYESDKLTLTSGGSESALDVEQTAELMQYIELKTYHHAHEIIQYVESTYNVNYSVPGMNKCLHRNGFSDEKATGHPPQADKQKQSSFICKYRCLKKSLTKDEVLLFMDSAHPTQATKLSYAWIRKGETNPVNTGGSRTRINLIGAINLANIGETQVGEYSMINADAIFDFMTDIRKNHEKKQRIHLVLDNAGYHRSSEDKKEAKRLKITLHYLPPYSPNLNPIERLWKVLNEHVRNNQFFKSYKDFKEAICHFFEETLSPITASLSSRINNNFQKL